MLRSALIAIFFSIGTLASAGCGEVEELIDCADICEDFEDCIGDEFDQSQCVDSCEDQPSNQIDTCDACLDGDGDQCVDCAAACAPLAI